eukprot:1812206-Lingulodinium_polyedra.AAC.1
MASSHICQTAMLTRSPAPSFGALLLKSSSETPPSRARRRAQGRTGSHSLPLRIVDVARCTGPAL